MMVVLSCQPIADGPNEVQREPVFGDEQHSHDSRLKI